MLLEVLGLLGGLAVLVKASAVTIDASSKLAKAAGVSGLTIGFILLAVLTSLPELSIAIISSLEGSVLTVGNVFGANVANMTLVFGAMALAGWSFYISKKDYSKIAQILLLAAIVSVFSLALGGTDFTFGVFLLIIFFVFSKALVAEDRKNNGKRSRGKRNGTLRYLAIVLGSIAIVLVSAFVVTESAIALAKSFSISAAIIGATVVSFGSTLPELSVSLAAIRKRQPQIAIGNIAGSLLANITLILGIASIIRPIAYTYEINAIIVSFLLVSTLFLLMSRSLHLSWRYGIAMLLVYLAFIATALTLA